MKCYVSVQVTYLLDSSLQPAQTLDYLGMTLQSSPLRAFPTQAWVRKVLSLVEEFSLSREQQLSLWRSLLGVMSSLSTLIPRSHLRMRSLRLSQRVGFAVVGGRADLLERLLPPGSSVVVRCQPSRGRSVPRAAPTEAASLHRRFGRGLGCVTIRRSPVRLVVSRCFNVFDQPLQTPGCVVGNSWLPPSLSGHLVSLFTNNTTTLSYLRKEGGTRSSTPNAVAQAILHLCEDNGVRLLPQFVPGRLNVLADSLSRGSQVQGLEWTLCMDVCRELFCH